MHKLYWLFFIQATKVNQQAEQSSDFSFSLVLWFTSITYCSRFHFKSSAVSLKTWCTWHGCDTYPIFSQLFKVIWDFITDLRLCLWGNSPKPRIFTSLCVVLSTEALVRLSEAAQLISTAKRADFQTILPVLIKKSSSCVSAISRQKLWPINTVFNLLTRTRTWTLSELFVCTCHCFQTDKVKQDKMNLDKLYIILKV